MKGLPVRPARGGFTLVELLVVIGVISLLVALLLPIVADAPKRANRLRCASNLGQIYRGARLYSNEAQGMLPDLYAGIPTDFAKQEARYRTSHTARNTDASGQEVPCGLWLLVTRHFTDTPNVLYCPGTPPGRRLGGTLNPAVNDIPQMAGFAYNYFPDTIPPGTAGALPAPPGVLLAEVSNDLIQSRAQRFYALLADVFLDEAELPHGSNRLNCVYWDGSAQSLDTTSKPIPWNAASTVPGGGATRTFSDDLAGYTAVRDAWVALSELRR